MYFPSWKWICMCLFDLYLDLKILCPFHLLQAAKWSTICFFVFLFFNFFFSWRLIYNIVVVFAIHWHESAMDLYVFPIPVPPPTSLSTWSLWVFPLHQARALVSCIQPGLVICFTLDNIHVSMLFSWNIPSSPSPTESTSLFLHLSLFFCFAYRVIVTIFLNSIYMC